MLRRGPAESLFLLTGDNFKSQVSRGVSSNAHSPENRKEMIDSAEEAHDAAAGMSTPSPASVVINSFADVCEKEMNCFCYRLFFVCVVGAARSNLGRSLLAFGERRCWLVDVTNCAFYLIRLLASLSHGNVRAVPKKRAVSSRVL